MKTVHLSLDVKGLLRWPDKRLTGLIVNNETGRHLSPNEARDFLLDELSKGHLVLPYGKACEGFSFTDGCPGHPETEA